MHVDNSSNANRLGAGLILTSLEGDVIQYALHFRFSSINNEAKFEALIIGLKISKKLGVQHLKAYNDSQLVIGHVLNKYEAKKENM